MDSGFFSLKGLLEMRKRRVYGSVLVKNRRYWHRGVYGYAINNYVRSKNIGDVGCLSGEWEKTELNIFVLKESDYNITMMSTFSGLIVTEGQKEERSMVNGEIVNFKYPQVVAYHCIYRGGVK